MNPCKTSLIIKEKSKKSSINLGKKSSQSKVTKQKLTNGIKENSAEKENNKNNSNQKRKIIKNKTKTKKVKNKSNKNFSKGTTLTNLSSFKYKNKIKSPEKNYVSFNLENLLINTKVSEDKKNLIEKDEYREMFSKYVRDDYSNSILESLLVDDFKNSNFLEEHKITPRMRTRMADWMIEVLSNYNCDDLTYFESINIMDRYFKECAQRKIVLNPEDLHLIGVTSMFI